MRCDCLFVFFTPISPSAVLPEAVFTVLAENLSAAPPKSYRPQAAWGSGDFPCKWRFDIKMLCLRGHRRPAAMSTGPAGGGAFFQRKIDFISRNGEQRAR